MKETELQQLRKILEEETPLNVYCIDRVIRMFKLNTMKGDE